MDYRRFHDGAEAARRYARVTLQAAADTDRNFTTANPPAATRPAADDNCSATTDTAQLAATGPAGWAAPVPLPVPAAPARGRHRRPRQHRLGWWPWRAA